MSALALVRGVERHRPLVPFAYASHGDALRVAIEVALSLPLSERTVVMIQRGAWPRLPILTLARPVTILSMSPPHKLW